MKIVQLLPELNEGGVERGVVELSRGLIQQGHESVIISNGGKLVAQLEREGALHVRLDVCSKNVLSAPWRVFKLYRTLQKINPDILHVRSRVPAWMVFFANSLLHIPVVSTVHGFNSVGFYSSIMAKANHIICVSTAIKDYIQTHYKTPDGTITVIPRGVDLAAFNPNSVDLSFIENFKKEFQLHDKWVVTTVGRITQLKDLETFIKAIAILSKTFPNCVGLIVGGIRHDKENYFKLLQNLVQSLHVEKSIIFTGSVAQVAEVYSLSDVVISSSKKPESFGRSVAEALALNTPVIATRHGGVLDILHEGEQGYFIEIGDSKALADKILEARNLKFDGFSYIGQFFSLEKMIKNTIKVYENVKR
jgi:glycosyltransferase involved in cell wall biosynthesis